MADVEHASLTDPEIHEPKGVASASQGEVYVADGVGSGNWVNNVPQGWGLYHDAAAAQTVNTTGLFLSIDGLGTKTEESYLPREIRGVSSLWDTTTDEFVPISEGDFYLLHLEGTLSNLTGAPDYIKCEFDQGTSASAPTNVVETEFVHNLTDLHLSVSFHIPVSVTMIGNNGRIFLSTDVGSADISGHWITIERLSSGQL